MKADFRDALLHSFETRALHHPACGEEWGVFNGQLMPDNEFLTAENAVFEQGFRAAFLDLEKAGCQVVPELGTDAAFDHCVVMTGRVRHNNELDFSRAWKATRTGGTITIVGDKAAGTGSLRKWVGERFALADSVSKHHAICFWVTKTIDHTAHSLPDPASKRHLFSEGKADRGSALLVEFLGDRIRGKVADLGAGNGYLTKKLLVQAPQVLTVDLYEADWHALEQAKASLGSGSKTELAFHWSDITREFQRKPFDWIIMNPPFHHGLHGGRAADPGLGKSFIQTAASSLVSGGRLLMVANRSLPYEAEIARAFRKTERLADRDGYKVFEAIK